MAVLLILLPYLFNSRWEIPEVGFFHFIYWTSYLVASVVFIWISMGKGFLRAAYYAVLACAVQHIAYDLYLIYAILGGDNYLITVFILSLFILPLIYIWLKNFRKEIILQ